MTEDGPRHFETKEEFEEFKERVWRKYTYRFGDWKFNWLTQEVNGVHLGPMETDILLVLIENLERPLPLTRIGSLLGQKKGDYSRSPDNIKTVIERLRKKVGPGRIMSIHRAGYVFVPFPEVD